jgi:predicted transcriptional regulator of viral defense system
MIRVISPRTNLRIATIERTLLDTLQYPFHCGGMEVALEAWERHIEQIDSDLLVDYLRTIQIDPLIRRVGAVFNLLGIQPAKDLNSFLQESMSRILVQADVPEIPLFRGINCQRRNHSWKILVP